MNWSASTFGFIFIAFVVYIFSAGDQSKWKAIFTTRVTGIPVSGTQTAASPTTTLGSMNTAQTQSVLNDLYSTPSNTTTLGSMDTEQTQSVLNDLYSV